MRKIFFPIIIIVILIAGFVVINMMRPSAFQEKREIDAPKESYWFLLHRKSNIEDMYFGIPGASESSKLVKEFKVKSGIPGGRPTPLPQLVGREYWLITKKESSADNPETVPYFITLDIPAPSEYPYGPVPYEECVGQFGGAPFNEAGRQDKKQCDWILPGFFGLHGVNGDESRLSDENPGSSGCVRHYDEDITYLYNLLEPGKDEIRYYVNDD